MLQFFALRKGAIDNGDSDNNESVTGRMKTGMTAGQVGDLSVPGKSTLRVPSVVSTKTAAAQTTLSMVRG